MQAAVGEGRLAQMSLSKERLVFQAVDFLTGRGEEEVWGAGGAPC